jgi:hypothetical protein
MEVQDEGMMCGHPSALGLSALGLRIESERIPEIRPGLQNLELRALDGSTESRHQRDRGHQNHSADLGELALLSFVSASGVFFQRIVTLAGLVAKTNIDLGGPRKHYFNHLSPSRTHTMPQIVIDPESRSLDERFALIKTPRRNRSRYPEGCVTPVAREQDARARAEPEQNLHAALVYGPSKSSEGQRIYYLVRWLD